MTKNFKKIVLNEPIVQTLQICPNCCFLLLKKFKCMPSVAKVVFQALTCFLTFFVFFGLTLVNDSLTPVVIV